MKETAYLIENLRDIHLSESVGLWPLAPVTILLLILSLVVIFIGIIFFIRWYQRQQAKWEAKKILNKIEKNYRLKKQNGAAIRELSILFRRVSLAYYPRQEVAGLTGESWLTFLKKSSGMQEFGGEMGRILLSAPYEAETEVDIKTWCQLMRKWINRVGKL